MVDACCLAVTLRRSNLTPETSDGYLKQFFRPCVKDIPPLSREMFTFDCLCENAVFSKPVLSCARTLSGRI